MGRDYFQGMDRYRSLSAKELGAWYHPVSALVDPEQQLSLTSDVLWSAPIFKIT